MLVDAKTGRVLTPAKLYNEAQSHEAVAAAKVIIRRYIRQLSVLANVLIVFSTAHLMKHCLLLWLPA